MASTPKRTLRNQTQSRAIQWCKNLSLNKRKIFSIAALSTSHSRGGGGERHSADDWLPPAELQTVLDAIAERAARLCDAGDAGVWRLNGDVRRRVAHFGPMPTASALSEGGVFDRGTPVGRAIIDRQTIHVYDLRAAAAEFPGNRGTALGIRTVLVAPLLHAGVAIGAIQIRRLQVRPFSDSQIKLLETFADQAVIAIENARLIHAQQARNRDLTEALSSRPPRAKFCA